MQNNGFKILLTVFFLGLCFWYLWPSAQTYYYNQQMNNMEEAEREAYFQENYEAIQAAQQRSLKLGLDLLGGMHVTMEVRVDELLRGLAQDPDESFEEVVQFATERNLEEGISVIDAFVQEFENRDPEARLSRYFRNPDRDITRRSSNDEVAEYLRAQSDEAVERAIEIIRNRVDRYGVTEPSIQRQGSRRVVVELPGVDDPERVRNLLRGTAQLEFRLMADPEELTRSLQDIIAYYDEIDPAELEDEVQDALEGMPDDDERLDESELPGVVGGDAPTSDQDVADTDPQAAADDEAVQEMLEESDDPDAALDELLAQEGGDLASGNPLLDVMQPMGQSVVFGYVSEPDTAVANQLLHRDEPRAMLPPNIELMYGSRTAGTDPRGFEILELLGVREEVELAGETVTNARVDFDETNRPRVSLSMDSDGARTWARITGANVGNQVAIVLDGVVYSYPVIQDRIVGGQTSITGLQSRQEAQDIVNVLMSGALPAPVDIVQERTVGPSLGAASIRAGFISVVGGLLLVALFMIMYYRTAGVVADLALLINIIFILGILAGFEATLTLPGIAGIVLTIGMAVDANVLIFDRIREEQRAGKTLRAAINGGYAKALSAIFDANITTFFVGVILYSFGVGPIQGFAVTLMAGILASLFSAIIITRIIFDYMVEEKKLSVNYG